MPSLPQLISQKLWFQVSSKLLDDLKSLNAEEARRVMEEFIFPNAPHLISDTSCSYCVFVVWNFIKEGDFEEAQRILESFKACFPDPVKEVDLIVLGEQISLKSRKLYDKDLYNDVELYQIHEECQKLSELYNSLKSYTQLLTIVYLRASLLVKGLCWDGRDDEFCEKNGCSSGYIKNILGQMNDIMQTADSDKNNFNVLRNIGISEDVRLTLAHMVNECGIEEDSQENMDDKRGKYMNYSLINSKMAFGCAQMLCVSRDIIGKNDHLMKLLSKEDDSTYLSFCFSLIEKAQKCREKGTKMELEFPDDLGYNCLIVSLIPNWIDGTIDFVKNTITIKGIKFIPTKKGVLHLLNMLDKMLQCNKQ